MRRGERINVIFNGAEWRKEKVTGKRIFDNDQDIFSKYRDETANAVSLVLREAGTLRDIITGTLKP